MKAWILGSLYEDILREIVTVVTSEDVWLALAQHFNKVSSSRLFELQSKLQNCEKLDKSMDEYIKEIKRVCEQLAFIGSPVSEKMKIFAALHGLGREYEPIKTSIEGFMDLQPPPTFESVIPRLKGYADRLTNYSGGEVTPHMAFVTTSPGSYGNYNNNGRGIGNN